MPTNLLIFLFLNLFGGNQENAIKLKIKNLQDKKGKILIALYDSPTGFPGDEKKSVKSWVLDPAKDYVLTEIPPGKYAMAVLHDVDGNMRMTYNWMGIPKEGFGFSKVEPSLISRPDYKKSEFEHKKGGTSLEISMYY